MRCAATLRLKRYSTDGQGPRRIRSKKSLPQPVLSDLESFLTSLDILQLTESKQTVPVYHNSSFVERGNHASIFSTPGIFAE